jgi:hypothetical protein
MQALAVRYGVPPVAIASVYWRCENSKVLACLEDSTISCAQTDSSRDPSDQLLQYCAQAGNAGFAPASVGGRPSAWIWQCEAGAPMIVRRLPDLDDKGYFTRIWFEVSVSDWEAAAAFSDPAAYCAAVGTVDAPDARWAGDPSPAVIRARAVATIGEVFVKGEVVQWRCDSGKVRWCVHYGTHYCDQYDPSTVPSPQLVQYCAEHRETRLVPPGVSPWFSAWAWACRDGTPSTDGRVELDQRGFASGSWYTL